MLRGLVKRLCFPVEYFSSRGFDSAQLFPTIWQAIRVLETVGFQVAALVCQLHQAVDSTEFMNLQWENKSPNGVV